jgi:hypothetical protein
VARAEGREDWWCGPFLVRGGTSRDQRSTTYSDEASLPRHVNVLDGFLVEIERHDELENVRKKSPPDI